MNLKRAAAVGVVLALVALLLFIMYPEIFTLSIGPEEEKPEALPKLKLKIAVKNAITDNWYSGVSVTIYSGSEKLEAVTTDTSGVAYTVSYYDPGTYTLVLSVGNTKASATITVGKEDIIKEGETEYYFKTVSIVPLGTFEIPYILDPDANKITSGGSYNVTAAGKTKPTFTLYLNNTAENTGASTFVNPVTGRTTGFYVVVEFNGKPLSITSSGWTLVYSDSLKSIWVYHVDESKLWTYYDEKNEQWVIGLVTITMQVDASTVTSGSTVTVTITPYAYLDPNYMKDNAGKVNSEAVAFTSFTLSIEG